MYFINLSVINLPTACFDISIGITVASRLLTINRYLCKVFTTYYSGMIKTLIFDFGGVIATISRDKAVAAFTRIGLNDADSRLDKYHQSGIFQALEEGKLDETGFRAELGRLCNRELSFEEVKKAWLGFFVEVPPAILKYLEELKKEYRILILSNTNPYVMSWACSTDFSAEGKPLTHYADRLYLSYQIGYTKPAAEIFRHLIDDSGIRPEETLFVDDGASNVKKREEFGFHTFCPANGSDWRSDLSALLQRLG